jgi:hypothetical protein
MSGVNYIEAFLCAGLLFFLLWLEWRERRERRRRLWWRVAATFVAVGALAGLILPLSYRHRVVENFGNRGDTAVVSREGFGWVDWQRRLEVGDSLVLQGSWKAAPGSGPVKLVLSGFGAVLDSTVTDGDFLLATVPAQAGRAVYRLAAVRGRDTVEREEIPVETVKGRPIRVLVLAVTPDFETTFLVDWLEKSGRQAAMRTKVSQEKYRMSFVNMNERELERLSLPMLDGFDVAIVDEALAGAAPAEWGLLRRAVSERGLGLIVRTDSLVVRKREGMRSLVVDSLARPEMAGELLGLGKVIYTGLNETYARRLGGDSVGYASYWSEVLRQVARRRQEADEWDWQPRICLVGDEVALSLRTGEAMPQGIVSQDRRVSTVYLAEDEVLPFRWSGRYWPDTSGWAAINDSNWLYVWPRGSWGAMEGRQLSKVVKGANEKVEVVRVLLPRFWMYAVLLLSIFFLWVERKIF